jgi:zinc protease
MRIEKILIASLCLLMTGLVQAGVEIEHWTTPTGARVYFVARDALPILDVQIDVTAGSAQDPAGKSGLAAITRGLLDAGVEAVGDRPGEEALDEERIAGRIVDLGIKFGGGVDGDRSSISLRTLSDPALRDGGLALMRRLLAAPSFPEAVLAREKTRTIAALQDAETRPGTVLSKRFAAALYGDHPYGRSPSVESVAAITRADIVAFHRSHYSANGAVISMIGNISRADAERIAADLASALPTHAPVAAVPPVTVPAKAEVTRIAHPSAQAHIAVGMPAVKRSDPEYYALLVGNYTLGGGGFVSRLMQEVREKRGYAYDVHSYFAPRKLEGPFQIGLQTRREQADEALKVVHEVLGGYLKHGPSEAQLKAAKQYYIDGLALRIDSNAKLLGYLSSIGFYELPLTYIDDYPKLIGSVTAEQVRAAFASHVQEDRLVTVIVGAER